MKKLMLSTVMASLLLTGCTTTRDYMLPVALMGGAVISGLTPDTCKAFKKPDDGSRFAYPCRIKHNYAPIVHDELGDAIIDKDGNFLMEYRHYYLMREIKPNYFKAQTYGKINKSGVFDKRGNIIVPFEYKSIDEYEKLIRAEKFPNADGSYSDNQKFIYYDYQGNVVQK
ncbi:hypothetical protein [Moraxella sp. ZY210820]|uniref:hypothetical protein n=1 Tax=unclassified Moraxella TaxID=2685852 RepID=UPI00272FDB43|nr:hypothetical protein [Moraxella sp. ZY210820]WLF84681.1 hypothetical protein LU301_04190 [Moraxella sp. ZY210820]